MLKKKLSMLIIAAMLLSSLASCGKEGAATSSNGSTREPTSSTDTDTDKTVLTDEELSVINDRLTELKENAGAGYDGAEINAVGVDDISFPTEDDLTGNTESDAVYNRNIAVEKDFKVKLTKTLVDLPPDIQVVVSQDQSAGTGAINLAYCGIVSTGQAIFNNGYAMPVDALTQIDLENPWWQPTLTDYYAIGDKLYFLSGDMMPEYFERPTCIMFSKKILKDYGVDEDLYALVRDGGWTVDKMFEIASHVPTGGDVMRYGPADGGAGISLYFGAGNTVTKFDGEHIPYVEDSLPSGIMDFAVKVSSQTGDTSQAYRFNVEEGHGKLELEEIFADDGILFLFDTANGIARMRELNVENFGILPNPKGTAEQEKYYTYTSTDGSSALFVPRCEGKEDMMGTIIEAMGAYSYMHIRPAFYDKRLKSQSVYDLESKEMLDLIYSTQVYDLYDLYGGGSYETGNGELFGDINEAVLTDPSNLVSSYTATIRLTKVSIKKMVTNAEKYGG